ncbi:hypothetical protein [Burkholderia multivorans]|uniref:hypothetical protein n=1 Tax=Burkholderia multivorans TaxID=87883 RepID=UPI0012FDE0ED|nr:hypothetical protein [Burkholderia multivorans]MBU9472075.1 hypothetical protein [Burkholderia multivorans]
MTVIKWETIEQPHILKAEAKFDNVYLGTKAFDLVEKWIRENGYEEEAQLALYRVRDEQVRSMWRGEVVHESSNVNISAKLKVTLYGQAAVQFKLQILQQ